MSYDLDLYIGKESALTPPRAGEGANFAVDRPARLEKDDIPPEYRSLVGRRRWLVRFYIEGQPDPRELSTFESWLVETVEDTNGVLIDEQAGRFQTAKKTGPLPDAAPSDDAGWGEMTFYFNDANTFHANGLAPLLGVIQEVLPEAMPARFGQYEPLQGKIENGDTGPLLDAFAADPEQFLKARTPFAHIYMHLPCEAHLAKWHPNHSIRREFLASCITFELRPRAFDDPRLKRLLRAISAELDVFYSEIRQDACPVSAWFWRGLPTGPVHAFCLGQPYLDLWPDARERGDELAGDLVFIAPTRLDPTLPEPPEELVDPGIGSGPRCTDPAPYAPVFPFEAPNH